MKLRFKPVYGYGWRAADNELLEVPAPFHLEGPSAEPPKLAGAVLDREHMLSDLWVVLTPRTAVSYNVCAYESAPIPGQDDEPSITGFAMLDTDPGV